MLCLQAKSNAKASSLTNGCCYFLFQLFTLSEVKDQKKKSQSRSLGVNTALQVNKTNGTHQTMICFDSSRCRVPYSYRYQCDHVFYHYPLLSMPSCRLYLLYSIERKENKDRQNDLQILCNVTFILFTNELEHSAIN